MAIAAHTFSIRLSLGAVLLLACSRPDASILQRAEASPDPASIFINRVWQVRGSSAVEVGTLYTFLSGGTLVIASPHGTPSLGSWRYSGDTLTLVEEGLSHPADVLTLTPDEFRIRVRSPGPPLDITLAPAEIPPPEEMDATR
jgi:hypothetical protein